MLEDKDTIRERMHRHCLCMDEGRFAELASLFAADRVWSAPYRTATGPSDIEAWLALPAAGADPRVQGENAPPTTVKTPAPLSVDTSLARHWVGGA